MPDEKTSGLSAGRKRILFLLSTLILILLIYGLYPFLSITRINDKRTVTLRPGKKVSYSYKKHESVRYSAEYEIGDISVLRHIETKINYLYPEKRGMPGPPSSRRCSSGRG